MLEQLIRGLLIGSLFSCNSCTLDVKKADQELFFNLPKDKTINMGEVDINGFYPDFRNGRFHCLEGNVVYAFPVYTRTIQDKNYIHSHTSYLNIPQQGASEVCMGSETTMYIGRKANRVVLLLERRNPLIIAEILDQDIGFIIGHDTDYSSRKLRGNSNCR